MAVYRPTYKDPKTGEIKTSKVWWSEFQFNGERIRRSTKQTNKRVAEQIEAVHKASLAKGEVGMVDRPAAPTLREFAPRFEAALPTLRQTKPETVKFYGEKLRRLLEYRPLADARLNTIDEACIDSYKQHRSHQLSRHKKAVSPASVNRELATLRRLLHVAYKWKLIDRIPQIEMLDGERNREFVLSPEQESLYLEMAPQPLKDLALLILDTGLRDGEASRLEWPDIHLEPAEGARFGYVHIRGGSRKSRKRNLSLTERVRKMLEDRKETSTSRRLVFPGKNPLRPILVTSLDHQHAELRKLLKLPNEFVIHSLRHTFGTRLGESGADAFTIMRLMGHSSVTVSQRYVHPSPESLERAFERLEALNSKRRAMLGKVPQVVPKVDSGRLAEFASKQLKN